jgi:hypothetical protein
MSPLTTMWPCGNTLSTLTGHIDRLNLHHRAIDVTRETHSPTKSPKATKTRDPFDRLQDPYTLTPAKPMKEGGSVLLNGVGGGVATHCAQKISSHGFERKELFGSLTYSTLTT